MRAEPIPKTSPKKPRRKLPKRDNRADVIKAEIEYLKSLDQRKPNIYARALIKEIPTKYRNAHRKELADLLTLCDSGKLLDDIRLEEDIIFPGTQAEIAKFLELGITTYKRRLSWWIQEGWVEQGYKYLKLGEVKVVRKPRKYYDPDTGEKKRIWELKNDVKWLKLAKFNSPKSDYLNPNQYKKWTIEMRDRTLIRNNSGKIRVFLL